MTYRAAVQSVGPLQGGCMYRVFTRSWWKEATTPGWPNNLEPCAGRKQTLRRYLTTETEARALCQRWNTSHRPGRYSRKAEYEET